MDVESSQGSVKVRALHDVRFEWLMPGRCQGCYPEHSDRRELPRLFCLLKSEVMEWGVFGEGCPNFLSPLRAREFLSSITRGKVASGRQTIRPVATCHGFSMGQHLATDAVRKAIERYIEQRGENRFTTADIARFMGVEEYPVRAAVSWLARYGLIEIIPGVRSKRYRSMPTDRRPHDNDYSVSMYRIKEPSCEANFAALMGVFCRG